jgi:hypothetical protein
LDTDLAKAKIGISKINILDIENKLQFGTYNDRAQNLSEVNKMIMSFEKHGRQWYKESNALAIVIEPSYLHNGQDLTGNWSDLESLKAVKFGDRKPLICASGQHRVAALRKMAKAFIDEQTMLLKHIERIEGVKEHSDDSVLEHQDLRTHLAVVKGELEDLGNWSIVLYNKGMSWTIMCGCVYLRIWSRI